MRILLFRGDGVIEPWVRDFAALGFETVVWSEGAVTPPCDYAVVWGPTPALLEQLASVKAVFLMGAGVDALLKFGDTLPKVPIIRIGDAGMGVQMAEYVAHAVLRYYRRFDEYEAQARRGEWKPLPQYRKQDCGIGVLGLGKLGMHVVGAMRHFGFPVYGWSRTPRHIDGVDCFSGSDGLQALLRQSRVLVSMLPLTLDTADLLDRERLSLLPRGAYLVNVARGAQVVDNDLLELVREGHIAGATLDVFREEPLPPSHPFWNEPRITITPHISALTVRAESVSQIAAKIDALEQGQPVDDVVDLNRGY